MIERWPAEDMVVEILDQSVAGGGSACNFAVDIRRLDPAMPVGTIGVIGDDAFGKVLERTIDENGIERYGVVITDAAATNFTDAYSVRATGRRTHLFHAGTSELLSPEHFDFGRTNARILHLGLPGIHKLMDAPWGDAPSGWAAVLKAAQAAGIETNLEMLQIDPARLRAIVEPCLGAARLPRGQRLRGRGADRAADGGGRRHRRRRLRRRRRRGDGAGRPCASSRSTSRAGHRLRARRHRDAARLGRRAPRPRFAAPTGPATPSRPE